MSSIAPVLVTPPATAPVSLAEAKLQLRVEHEDEDTYIESLIQAATGHLDGWTGIVGGCLITQTWRQDVGCFPSTRRIHLPLGPSSAAAIKYYDETNVEQTLAADLYEGPFPGALGPWLAIRPEASLPATFDRHDAVQITFVAGYGAAADVPAPIKHAILLLVGHWYANREAVAIGTISTTIQFAVDALTAPYRRVGF